jgi:hypothetical protein
MIKNNGGSHCLKRYGLFIRELNDDLAIVFVFNTILWAETTDDFDVPSTHLLSIQSKDQCEVVVKVSSITISSPINYSKKEKEGERQNQTSLS